MTVSVKKIKVDDGELTAGQVVGYLVDSQPAGDYYSEDSQAYLRWFTTERVKGLFALSDKFSRLDLQRFIEGRDPVTGESIRKAGSNKTRVAAVDLTVSAAPKSVSILWALADPALRFEIELMIGMANDLAVGRLLDEHPLIRVTERGKTMPAIARDYVVAQAHHTTARLTKNARGVPDPQLHIHNLLVGAIDDRGQLRAIESRYVMDAQAAVDAEAAAALAALLQEAGFELELGDIDRRPGSGQPRRLWELKGIPQSLVTEMSSRTSEIEDLKRQYTEATGREAVGDGWDAFVMSHRGPKAKVAPPELDAEWQVESAAHGLTPADVAAMREIAHARREAAGPLGTEAGRRAAKHEKWRGSLEATEFRGLMLEWICRDHAFIPYGEMDRLAHQLAVGLLSPREADGVTAEMIGDGDLIVTTDRMVTTLEILSYEQRVKEAVAALLAAEPGSAVAEELIEAELARREAEEAPLDEGQAEAVRLAVSGARFVSITGKAGTGKGYATSVMTKLWHTTGRRVTAVAVAGRTAQQAGADSGADEAMTVDKLRVAMAEEADRVNGAIRSAALRLDSRDVLLVDEAGMLDHHRYAPLVEAAVSSGATLVQVGDDKQLSPVGPGGLWTVSHRQAQAAGKAVELREIHRAEDRREARAWDDLRDGRVREALSWMREQDRIRLYDTRPELLAGMVEEWWAGDRDGLMVTDTSNGERDQLNELAQARRLEAGELGAETVQLGSGRKVHVGDRVLFSHIYRPGVRGVRRVENGTTAVVLAVDPVEATIEVELSEPKRRQPRRMVLGPAAPLELGYARHVAKAQGVTANDTDLAVSRHTAHNELYVMATRARNGARVHAITAQLAEGLDVTPDELRGTAGEPRQPEEVSRPSTLSDQSSEPQPATIEAVAGELPPGATPWKEFTASWTTRERVAVLREDPRVWSATVDQISRRAARSHTKEAVGDRQSAAPLPELEGRHDGEEQRASLDAVRKVDRARSDELQAERTIASGVRSARVSQPAADPQVRRLAEYMADIAELQDSEHLYSAERASAVRSAADELFGPDADPRTRLLADYAARLAQLKGSEHLYAAERASVARSAADELLGADTDADPQMRRLAEYAAYLAQLQGSDHLYPSERARLARVAADALFGSERSPAEPLPARDVMENAGRERIEAGEMSGAAAYYRLLGRMHEAEDPAALAAELVEQDPAAVVVVGDEDQERRVRAALAGYTAQESHAATPGDRLAAGEAAKSQPVTLSDLSVTDPEQLSSVPSRPESEKDPWTGRIVLARHAYEERRQRREAWADSDPRAQRAAHVVEPGAVQRAYVLAPELVASDDLIRAVSVAAESHLLTRPLRPALAGEVQAQAEDIERTQRERDQERSAEQAKDAELVHERQARGAQAGREGVRSAERL